MSYIDLYLIHFPHCWEEICKQKPEGTWKDSWKVMEEYHNNGVLKNIGVSNFDFSILKELLSFAKVKPFLVQNYFSVGSVPKDVINLCNENGIKFMSYSSLSRQNIQENNLDVIRNIASKYNKTTHQVILKWQLSHGISVIPRSTNKDHIYENIDLFTWNLLDEDTNLMDEVSKFKS